MRNTILLLCLSLLVLTACSNTDAPKTITAPAQAQSTATAAPANGAMPSTCPSVGIVEDLRSMTLFQNNDKPDPAEIIGYGKVEDFDGACAYENGMATIDLDVMFSGRLGPKAIRGHSGEATAAFPYFIAISDDQGNVLNKEVFAVAMTFRTGLDATHQVEHIKPRIPLANPAMGPRYQVLIGFQLNREQLKFNRGGN